MTCAVNWIIVRERRAESTHPGLAGSRGKTVSGHLELSPDAVDDHDFYDSYIRHLSYCFYIAVNRICVAIFRVDGALKPWSAIHLGAGNSKQKPAYLDLPVPDM